MQQLESYLQGTWHPGSGTTLLDPTTGEAVAECGSQGLDLAGAVRHGRDVGGPALRAMTFPERAAMLKALAGAIHEIRDELLDLARQNGGNTRGDGKFDVDGATGTLAAYASFGKRLGDRPYLVDGEGVQLGRTPRFWGRHVRVPRPGLAVHINAFNFPAWGMMEKAACAWLAGVPVLSKPGSNTALVAWRIARCIVESGLVPEGGFQFLCGSAGDLLDHLGPMDGVAFTGSASTGLRIRSHPNLLEQGTRVNVEADSINAAVLAPDVEPGEATWDLALSNLATDITQKAGQKCTAVRRIFVPEQHADALLEDLGAELGRYRMGDPGERDTRVAPVAPGQIDDVLAGLERLKEAADVVHGGTRPEGPGAFLEPTLLRAKDAEAEVLHSLEVFGPVSTIVPYSGSAEDAARLANLGGGGLVISLYSDDAAWTESVTLGVAPWHGRVWIGSKRMAEQALAPGMVLPQMIHGGPGRAGGGEELGGLRGLDFYTQRVALQGFQGFLDGRFGPAEES